MILKSLTVFSFVLILCQFESSESCSGQLSVICSTIKILWRSCTQRLSQKMVDRFNACYDQAPGRPQFEKCQRKRLGGLFENDAVIKAGCRQIYRFVGYAMCIRSELEKVGIDFNEAVGKVNNCQRKVLGV